MRNKISVNILHFPKQVPLVILYNVCNRFRRWTIAQNYIFWECGPEKKNFVIFEIVAAYTTIGFFSKPGGSVWVPKNHIRWKARPLTFSLSVRKVLIKPVIPCQWLYVGYIPILHNDTQNFNGVLDFAETFFPLTNIRYIPQLRILFRYSICPF